MNIEDFKVKCDDSDDSHNGGQKEDTLKHQFYVPENMSLPQLLNAIFGTDAEREQDRKIRAERKRKAEMN